MKLIPSLVLLQALLLSDCRVRASRPVFVDDPAVNSRITETIRVARELRDSNRRLLACSESLPAIQRALGIGSETSCECVDIEGTDSSLVNCLDFCELCQPSLDTCVSYEYAFNFIQGNLSAFLGRLQYSRGRTDELQFQETYFGNGVDLATCSASVNGVDCNSCGPSPEGCEGGDAVVYDCSNIEAGAVFDECLGDFERIPETSVFVAYNTNFFNDGDCIFFPTASPIPTATPLPTQPPKSKTSAPTEPGSPTRPPLITRQLNPFHIAVEYLTLNGIEFDEAVLNYLTTELSRYFPEIAGVVLNRIGPDGAIPADEANFGYEGEAVFLGEAPLPLALEAAQRYMLRDLVSLQQAITSDPDVGDSVFVTDVLIKPDTRSPTSAPTDAPTPKGEEKKHKHLVYIWPKNKKSTKMSKKGSKHGSKRGKSKKEADKDYYYYHVAPSPTYYEPPSGYNKAMAYTMKTTYKPPPVPVPRMSWKYNRPTDSGGTWSKNNSDQSMMGGNKLLMYGTWSMGKSSSMGTWSRNGGSSMGNGLMHGGLWSKARPFNSGGTSEKRMNDGSSWWQMKYSGNNSNKNNNGYPSYWDRKMSSGYAWKSMKSMGMSSNQYQWQWKMKSGMKMMSWKMWKMESWKKKMMMGMR